MLEEFSVVDQTAHGRRVERFYTGAEFYDLEHPENLFSLLKDLEVLAEHQHLIRVHIYDLFAFAFSASTTDVRREPLMLSIFRARLQTPPSPALQAAYAAVQGLSGVVRRQQDGHCFMEFDEEARRKMRVIIDMELQEIDSLGVRIVLPPSPYESVFQTFLDRTWGLDEPAVHTASQSTVFTLAVPYDEDVFKLLTAARQHFSVC